MAFDQWYTHPTEHASSVHKNNIIHKQKISIQEFFTIHLIYYKTFRSIWKVSQLLVSALHPADGEEIINLELSHIFWVLIDYKHGGGGGPAQPKYPPPL